MCVLAVLAFIDFFRELLVIFLFGFNKIMQYLVRFIAFKDMPISSPKQKG